MKIRYLLCLFALLACNLAYSQEDTVVTTKLREVSVVGVKQTADTEMSAVTTVGAATLQRLNVVTMKGVSEIAPNFYIPDYGSRMTSSIYVRGLGARIDQPVIGLNVDGVPYLNKDNYDFDLFDIQKIDVYRGAQSILNGRNTMGGQVNIFTLSPWRYQGWRLMAEYGRANSIKAGVGYYGKIGPSLATSLTGYYTMSDGFFTNEYNHAKIDHEKQGSLRWKLSWHPSDRLSITNTASGSISRQGGYPYEHLESGKLAYNDTCFYRRTSFADGLVVGWSSKRVVVSSVTSVQYIDDNMTLDQDFTPADYFTLTQKRKEYALTEDLYAKGHRGNLHWLGGVFGFYKHMDMNAPVTFKDAGITNLIEARPNSMNPGYPIRWNDRQFVLGSDFVNIAKGVAVYGQTEYKLGNFNFELGLRWDVEWANLIYDSHCNTSYTIYQVMPDGDRQVYADRPVVINDHGHLSKSFGQLMPKFAVGYDVNPQVNVYANVAKGYKTGGYNTQMFSDVLQQRIMALMGMSMTYDVDEIVGYKPEKSWNFEIGTKAKLLGDKMDATACVFFINCTDQQMTTFPDGLTTGRIMTNAGRTRSLGAEATIAYRPVHSLLLRASYGYTDATFRSYNNGKNDYRGKRLPYAPQNTLFVSADWDLPFAICDAIPSVGANVRGIGDIYWDEDNTARQPFYATLGARVSLEHPHWSVSVWGENLTNTKYYTFYFLSVSNAFIQRSRPWQAGVTLRINI